jgi:membrane associated rhomboid family serine protease
MFPIRDENPSLHKSITTYAIIVINALVWLFIQNAGSNPGLIQSIFSFGLIPGELLGTLPPGTRVNIGNGIAYVIENTGNSMSLISHMFMHGGWFHIIGNMWFLAIFGDNVEDSMGSIRFLFFYLLCGLAAAATQMALGPTSAVPMVGASGAIGGVMGAYVVLYPRVPVHMLIFLGFFITRIIVPAYLVLGYWFLIQLASVAFAAKSPGGGVAFGAHIGGFISGVVLIFLFRKMDRVHEKRAQGGVWSSWKR